MGDLHTWVEDNPKAAGIASKVVGELAAAGHLTLGPCLRPILEARGGAGLDDEEGAEGEEEDLPPLVAAGVAGEDVLGNVLAAVSGDAVVVMTKARVAQTGGRRLGASVMGNVLAAVGSIKAAHLI